MILTKQELALLAIAAAEKAGVPPEMVCAIIEASSGWNASLTEWQPSTWLMGLHPQDIGGEGNWIALGTRWGAMQIRGQEAWMAGYKELSRMIDPDFNLEAGCVVLKKILGDERKTILTWYGTERRNLAMRTLAILPQCKLFTEARPCVLSTSS